MISVCFITIHLIILLLLIITWIAKKGYGEEKPAREAAARTPLPADDRFAPELLGRPRSELVGSSLK